VINGLAEHLVFGKPTPRGSAVQFGKRESCASRLEAVPQVVREKVVVLEPRSLGIGSSAPERDHDFSISSRDVFGCAGCR